LFGYGIELLLNISSGKLTTLTKLFYEKVSLKSEALTQVLDSMVFVRIKMIKKKKNTTPSERLLVASHSINCSPDGLTIDANYIR